ncbi:MULTISPECIES: ArsR/SmtB family transcription factor [unclassified Streptomyces]|uniref:ArsR/SmtB family transcription factor n=1 Tax=unclassified Streptomyces TaxID=2593676 RepID=UPI00225A29FE|nr:MULTISPECIES: helix-turn-helix domain-containing protein [unclassified Streptomyces]WSP54941.1 helix-turn-helix domain-containing protein [Streptomyces sp. NBC_01241]WSU24318.1 helix-turn-helix domain-containing protein [Streptomyces sp. NBC_01108]MCX4786609.1 helix-turn-helix domain-containing protein [Streptomyces sp. NBC_01221]MCX4797618.1 helix-turn-helix domain-containing protein [Streptomyces sp. NBC_01242]WSP65208.1 helix-turn-helix domain-containing protein [Streptomyces sp. NBC_012
MLRIHLSGVDLSKVRMATRPDALWETILSFHRLRDRRGPAVFGKWRTETRPRLNSEVRLLSAVIPPRGYFPDFLTPSQESGEPYGIDAGIQALRDTPPGRIRTELALLAAGRRESARTQDGRVESLDRLVGALRSYHRAAIEPYWPHIQASVEADRALRGRALLDGGAEELLASLPPMIRWRAPVLEADYPVDRELHLNGRGLLLQPSFFCRVTPVVQRDPRLPPVLVYPVTHSRAPVFAEPGPWLGRLLGHTRSTVLRAIGSGCTTSELARRAGVSLASASQHACVLREAGLIHTLRHGSSVLHTLTPLGGSLLRGGAPLALS